MWWKTACKAENENMVWSKFTYNILHQPRLGTVLSELQLKQFSLLSVY